MRRSTKLRAITVSIASAVLLCGCIAPPGYHYSSGDFTTPIPNDPCELSFVNSKGVLSWLNSSVGKPKGIPTPISSIKKSADAEFTEVNDLGFPTGPSTLACNVSAVTANGGSIKGLFDINNPGHSQPLVVSWASNSTIAAAEMVAKRRLHSQSISPPADFPQTCAQAHEIEMHAIPRILRLPLGAAKITGIQDIIPNMYPLPNGFHQWKLSCYITVLWSNGTRDYDYTFTMKNGRYGGYDMTYGSPSN